MYGQLSKLHYRAICQILPKYLSQSNCLHLVKQCSNDYNKIPKVMDWLRQKAAPTMVNTDYHRAIMSLKEYYNDKQTN